VNQFKKDLFSGVVYTAISKYSRIVIQLFITGILARILTPAEFGIVTISTVFFSVFMLVADFGLGPAIVQDRKLIDKELNHIYSFTVIAGIVFASIFYFGAPIASYVYDENLLINVCRILSLSLMFSIFAIVPMALLRKKKDFKYIAWSSVMVQIVGGGVSVVLAKNGKGVYALVIGQTISSFLQFLFCIWKVNVKFIFRIKLNPLKCLWKFSAYQLLFNFLNFFSRNLDKLLIGKVLGAVSLGYYDKSYRLMLLPVQNITNVITPVLHPLMSDHQDDKSTVYNKYIKIVKVLALIGFPLSAFLYSTSNEIIYIVFGNQWGGAVSVFKILSMSVGIQVVMSSIGSIFQAVNDTKGLFITGCFSFFLMSLFTFLGVFVYKSMEITAYLLVIAFCIDFIVNYVYLIKLSLNDKVWIFAKALVNPLIISLAIYFSLTICSTIIHPTSIAFSFAQKSLTTMIVYALLIIVLKEYRIVFGLNKQSL